MRRVAMGQGGGVVLLVIVLLCLPIGCGKKAPPIPPRRTPPTMQTTLGASLEKDQVLLTWQSQPFDPAVSGFGVYQSRIDSQHPDCPGCPMLFEKVGHLPLDRSRSKLNYRLDVASGYLYRFKVIPFFATGAQAAPSNVVEIRTLP